ncbi:hypothetical protein ABTZ03_14225 [Kitasatospora sp. NPDC096077]|uniref:hypothetical protein n=1 Tax=Kitasatospora sp. NPDC096077 TaxID=3155544 RepID=UPI00332D9213
MNAHADAGDLNRAMAAAASKAAAGIPGANLLAADLLADRIGDRKAAESYYRAAVDEGDEEAFNNYGCFLSEDDDRAEEAEEMFLRGISTGDPLAMENLGKHYFDLGDDEAAAEFLKKAVESGRNNALSYLARAESRSGRAAPALAHARMAAAHGVRSADLALAEALASDPAADPAEIDVAYRRAVAGSDEGAPFSYGRWLQDNGQPSKALSQYQDAADQGEINAFLNMGNILSDLGDPTRAEEMYRLGREASDPESAAALAELLASRERYSEATSAVGAAEALGLPPHRVTELQDLVTRARNHRPELDE